MKRLILVTALALLVPAVANAGPITAFSLFGGNSTGLGNNVIINSGIVGSNANVSLGGGSDALTVTGTGVLSGGNNLSINSAGNVIFNGNVTLGGGSLTTGDIDSGGNVVLGNNAVVNGNVRAGGTVTLGGGAQVLGNVDAGKTTAGPAVTLGNNAKVIGTITHNTGTTVSYGGGATAGGNVTGIPATPIPYVATTLPTPTVFSAGVADVSKVGGQTTTLSPGSYDDIVLGSNNILNLRAGNYYIDRLTLGGSSTINFDLTLGNISLFFTGNVVIGNNFDAVLNGGDASDIYAETKGDWGLGGGGQWYGTIFGSAAGSDINFGNNTGLTGALLATHNLDIGGGSTVNLLQADYLTPAGLSVNALAPSVNVPEPSSILLLATAFFGLAFRRSRPQ